MKTGLLFFAIVAVFLVAYLMYTDDIDTNGKLYSSKENLCAHFAKSYLRTIQKTDRARSTNDTFRHENLRWQMAIDIETDFYNLCILNLSTESLRDYKSTIIEKYQ